MTVDAVAAAIFAAILKDKLVPQPCREPATVDVPKGFVLVDGYSFDQLRLLSSPGENKS